MAASVVECLRNPAIVAEARRTFKEELAGIEYRPLLPRDQKPPVALNRAMMEKYRPLMAPHYVKEKPNFILSPEDRGEPPRSGGPAMSVK
jgi:hypothetical protein